MLNCRVLRLLFGIVLLSPYPAKAADSLIDASGYRSLVSDHRAYRLGEPLIVMVTESTMAESSAATGSQRDVSIGISAADTANGINLGLGLSGDDSGSGQTIRKGRAYSRISVRIHEILPGDLIKIAGEQTLVINGEAQKVVISGTIRVDDIEKDNSINSSRIADAKIEILGNGDIDSAQNKTLIYKIMNWLGLL